MASARFLYRSKKDRSNLIFRLSFTYNKDRIIEADSKIKVEADYWFKDFNTVISDKRNSDVIIHNRNVDALEKQKSLKEQLKKLEYFVLDEFDKIDSLLIDKEWLQNKIEFFYNPPTQGGNLPQNLVEYFEHYVKTENIKKGTIGKLNTSKNYIVRFNKTIKSPVLIKDVDLKFKQDMLTFFSDNNYNNPNTISLFFRNVKTICNSARKNGLEVSYQLQDVKSEYIAPDDIYLTSEELKKITDIKLTDKLDIVRDWLLIACYSAQRGSDFLRFNLDMIEKVENNKYILGFSQIKTGKNMTIPLYDDFIAILNKRDFQFPKTIDLRDFNRDVKIVCELAGLTYKVEGTKKIDKREVKDLYPKNELVSSHIGRRTFASLYYGIYSLAELTHITGHSSEKNYLTYVKKGDRQIAIDMLNKYS